MRIWDLHTHLYGVPGGTPAARMETLLRYADRMGIERVCVYMGTSFDYDPSPDEMRRQNDEVLAALEGHHDRALGFAYLNPNHVQASLAELDRCVAQGPMVGVKLWVGRRASNAALDPIVERAAALKALIFQHTYMKVGRGEEPGDGYGHAAGNLAGESTPMDLAALAARHPEVPFVCGHTGGDWELGLRAIRDVPNVSVGIAGSYPVNGMVEAAVAMLGAERVLYGSDVGIRAFGSQLGKVYGAAISEEARRLILGENLRRLLRPILERA